MFIRRQIAAALLLLLAGARTAYAQQPPGEATADELFQQGMQAFDAGDYPKACELLERSLKIDRGMAAQFRLAECQEKLGKTLLAWQNFREVETAARREGLAERADLAAKRAAEVEKRLTKIAIKVPAEVRGTRGLAIVRDGQPVPEAEFDQPIPLERGKHTIEASAPGRKPWSTTVELATDGETASVHVPVLLTIGDGAERPPPPVEAPSIQGPVGLVIGGAGIAIFASGVIAGLVAKGKHGDSDELCRGEEGVCTPAGADIRSDARVIGYAGTALSVIGGAAVIAGTIVWLTAPSDDAPESAQLRVGPGSLAVEGSF